MKTKLMHAAVFVLAMALTALVLAGCGAKNVTVQVSDAGTNTSIETQTGKTVKETLSKADITVGDKDVVEPALDSKIADNTKEIVIKRYAKVTVKTDAEEKNVEVTGGTVDDALKAAGVTLAEGESTDPALSTYVKDGMTVTVLTPKTVRFSLDGKSEQVTTMAATVQALLDERGVKLAAGDTVDPSADTKITEGMRVTVATAAYAQEQAAAAREAERQRDYDEGGGSDGGGEADAGSSGPSVVGRTDVPNCNNDGHGYYEITYSDGSTSYEEY